MSKTITAIYQDRASASIAVNRLVEQHIPQDDISVLLSDGTRGREFEIDEESKAPEGAATGAATGGVLGAIAAGLVAVGVIAVPGIGLLAAGPIVAALAGAGAGGAVGGVIGGLVGMGFPEHEAKLVSEELKKGGLLIGVKTHEDQAKRVREILKNTGGTHIHG